MDTNCKTSFDVLLNLLYWNQICFWILFRQLSWVIVSVNIVFCIWDPKMLRYNRSTDFMLELSIFESFILSEIEIVSFRFFFKTSVRKAFDKTEYTSLRTLGRTCRFEVTYMNKNEVLINEVIEDGKDSPRSSWTKDPHDIVSWDMLMDVPKDMYRTVGREWDIVRATNDHSLSLNDSTVFTMNF